MSFVEQILSFDKENLLDILHYLVKEIIRSTDLTEIRIYMEDMREGALVCLYTPEGELERRGARIPIQRRENPLVRSFLESRALMNAPLAAGSDDLHDAWYAERHLERCAIFPLANAHHSIGVLTLDFQEGQGEPLRSGQREEIRQLLTRVMPVLTKAHRFNQRTMLSRHLDRSRKRDVARILLQGAFELDMALDMVSVLIPVQSPVPEALRRERGGYMEVLAAASRKSSDLPIYETLERISLLEGKSLLSRLVRQDGERVVRRPGASWALFFEDILQEKFERRDVFTRLALRTLLMIPVEIEGGTVTCVVNYFTKLPHRFSESELKLLDNHARALGEGIRATGAEHFEIQVLSEIEQLLAEDVSLQEFLGKVVSRAVELVGADSGSVALVRERDQERWLLVEDEEGRLVGAKSRDWRKAHIPALHVGGEELPREHRSLTGYVAFTGRPFLCPDTEAEGARGGFYRNLVSDVKSELAVPIRVGETVLGVINLDSYVKGYFTQEHQRILLLISRLIASRIADQVKIAELRQKVVRLRREVSYKDPAVSSYLLGNIIGNSRAARHLVERISRLTVPLTNRLVNWNRGGEKDLALGLPTLLLTGETGAGKEFVFNNLYNLINEKFREAVEKQVELPLRKTNIAAFSGELTYTELFGHRKGAYTGAHADRTGILEEADGGIVFLDEIGDADLKTQVQLLRFLDSGEFSRLGETRIRRSRVIFVAATNRDLSREIEEGAFREDLYHRLSEMTLRVPSLAERREDIPDLARHFLGRLHSSYSLGETVPVLTDEAASLLSELQYPGNIRQLVTVLQGALFESEGGVVEARDVSSYLALAGEAQKEAATDASALYGMIRRGEGDFWTLVHSPFMEREITRQTVLEVYRMALAEGESVREAARLLRALPGEGNAEQASLNRFRNFMYKTVGLVKDE
ncbi:MAG: sigma 54-interacting transcriptional regulator [bacterium]|nr:MAG: sigma 54-interacting transcriptional regulator [bacterium]